MSQKMYAKVFGWLFLGLLVTFGTGLVLMNFENGVMNLLGGMGYLIAIVIEMGIALFFSFRIGKMSKATATFCYLLYSFVSGITFSILFLSFHVGTILYVFGITSIVFGIFALIGAKTKIRLDKIGTFLLIGLLAIILLGIINIFVGNQGLDLGLCIISVLIFVGFIAYDVQKLPLLLNGLGEDNGAIFGAFQLYLDFVNLFIHLLQLLGGGDRD